MRKFLCVIVIVLGTGSSALVAQMNRPKVLAEFKGSSLKWIHAADPAFRREKLDLDNYIVSVVEQEDSVIVLLISPDSVEGSRGSTGKYPGYEVEIRKKDLKIVRSNYER